ncbi:MAG: hypothetical protein NZ853_02640 [Leptospiraceae bacterium]|nr:hypothetical protein [Leptospiraceae bacterium]MDW7975077.1 hypothetical protein [Leptospiraceae bacterium]
MKLKLKKLLGLAFAIAAIPLYSQEEGIKWGGYVKVDWFQDSRAVVASRDDMYIFYPAPRRQVTEAPAVITDPQAKELYILSNNQDLNAVPQAHITTVQSRVNLTATGPTAFGAKTSGFIEIDFFGTANHEAWMTRLRHAHITLDWGATKLNAGMNWHPLFVAGYNPDTVQFSPSPFHVLNRSPLVRLTQDLGGGLNLHLFAVYRAYHSEFAAPATSIPGADGTITQTCTVTGAPGATCSVSPIPVYLTRPKRFASRPDIDIQLEYKSDLFSGGITLDFNEIRLYPTVVSYDGVTRDVQIGNNKNKVNGFTWQIFGRINFDKENNGQIRFAYLNGENTSHLLMIGGYAEKRNFLLDNLGALGVSPSDAALLRAFTLKEYTPVKIDAYWIQPIWGKSIEYSIILGKTDNKGTKDDSVGVTITTTGTPPTLTASLATPYFARGTPTLKSATSIIPQVRFRSGKTWIGVMYGIFEAEYLEDDKGFRTIYQQIKRDAGIATGDYRVLKLDQFFIPDPTIISTKGVPQRTYKVTDRRIQVSIQHNI